MKSLLWLATQIYTDYTVAVHPCSVLSENCLGSAITEWQIVHGTPSSAQFSASQWAVIGRWQSLADGSHWQIAVDSLRKRLFDSSRTAFGLPPSPQPRYMYYLKAMMGLEPRISSQGSTYFLALWFTIVKTHTLRYWRWCWPILWGYTPFLRLE